MFYYSRVYYSSHHRASRLRGGPLEIGGGGAKIFQCTNFFFLVEVACRIFFFYMEGLVIFGGEISLPGILLGGELSPPPPISNGPLLSLQFLSLTN